MKRTLMLLLLFVSCAVQAQNFDEWFHQKKTKIKYLLQQIAANKVYIDYLQKGYEVARSGLKTIDNIKHGDFSLHDGFFNSLKNVNPKIKGLAKVADIIALQLQIVKQVQQVIHQIKITGQFTVAEIKYIENVLNHLLGECATNINNLIDVITAGRTEMTDDERIKRINSIYTDIQDKYSFSKSFSFDAMMLAMQRMQEGTDVEVSRGLRARY